MLIQCTYGPVTTEVMGSQYNFDLDEFGRYVAEVWIPRHITVLTSVVHYRAVREQPMALESLNPASAVQGGPDLTLTCAGKGFVEGDTIVFNGGVEPTEFVSDTALTTTVKPLTVTTPGSYPVLVRSPTGVETDALDFTFDPAEPGEEEELVEEDEEELVEEEVEEEVEGESGGTPVTRISGVGAVLEGKLAEAGITSLEQIAALTEEELADLDMQLGLAGRTARDRWLEQAKALVG
jgi:predicted flap endonuclease-1-like 5' DNA nuclease